MMKEQIKFLKDLQTEMKEQDTDCQAHPRFWVVGDYKYVSAYEGCGDRQTIILPDSDSSFEISEYADYILEESSTNDFAEDKIEELKTIRSCKHIDTDDILNWCVENDEESAYMVEETKEHYIVPNTFFITKAEAKAHIRANHYHYSKEAHTYAMTAQRAPTVGKLWDTILSVDWDKLEVKE